MTIEKRRELVDILMSFAEQASGTNIGHLMGAIAIVIETEQESSFLKSNYDYFVRLLDESADELDGKLSYEEREFYNKFSELVESEEFPDVIE